VLRKSKNEYETMINPVILQRKFPFLYLERCYSIKGLYIVKRYLWVMVRYQNLDGVWQTRILRGLSGIYHEIDHINGITVSKIGFRIL